MKLNAPDGVEFETLYNARSKMPVLTIEFWLNWTIVRL